MNRGDSKRLRTRNVMAVRVANVERLGCRNTVRVQGRLKQLRRRLGPSRLGRERYRLEMAAKVEPLENAIETMVEV